MKDNIEDQNGATPYRIDEDQKTIVDFTLGSRLPTNQYERDLYKEIQEIKKQGYMVEIPFK